MFRVLTESLSLVLPDIVCRHGGLSALSGDLIIAFLIYADPG